jgi:agmatinase
LICENAVMSNTLTVPPKTFLQSFMGFEIVSDLDLLNADVAILGIPYGDPYTIAEVSNDQANAPTAVRQACPAAADRLERWDYDLGGTLFEGRDIKVVDCGDIPADVRNLPAHYAVAETAIRKIRKAGALPIVIGGDHGVTRSLECVRDIPAQCVPPVKCPM